MDTNKKQGRYQRIYLQLEEILPKTNDPYARMSSIIAVLHNKMDHFFWTGFYFLKDDKLIVGDEPTNLSNKIMEVLINQTILNCNLEQYSCEYLIPRYLKLIESIVD